MSRKTACLAVLAIALTAGIGTVAQAHRTLSQQTSATAPVCTTSYGTEIGPDGRSISVVNLTCPRPAPRLANGAAL